MFAVRRQASTGDRWSYLPSGFSDGWLCFESAAGKRRLAGFPADWAQRSDTELRKLLEQAQSASSERRHFGTIDRDPGAPDAGAR